MFLEDTSNHLYLYNFFRNNIEIENIHFRAKLTQNIMIKSCNNNNEILYIIGMTDAEHHLTAFCKLYERGNAKHSI